MMDTVLNLGLNDETVEALAADSGDARFAYDSYRRFIQMYSDVVLGLDHEVFEEILEDEKARARPRTRHRTDRRRMAGRHRALQGQGRGGTRQAVPAGSARAALGRDRRRVFELDERRAPSPTAACTTFPKAGARRSTSRPWCSAIWARPRPPASPSPAIRRPARRQLYGEFLVNAQGEDVVAGIRTPQNITEAARIAAGSDKPSLQKLMPEAFAAFVAISDRLEKHYRDMQDLEFTIERGKLWMLQTRSGKRTAKAALKIAVDMARDGLITKEEAVARIDPASLDQLLHPTIDPKAARDVIGVGLPASPGAATGEIVFSSDEAEDAEDARPQGHPGAHRDQPGGHPRHACRRRHPDHARRHDQPRRRRGARHGQALRVGRRLAARRLQGRHADRRWAQTFRKGDIITIDGGTGQVLKGAVPMLQPELSGDFAAIMEWADAARRMKVRTNAETPADARMARSFGAEGIGLCRTEHMFFEGDRIVAMREMILADTEKDRRAALAKLLPMQRSDFLELFEIMAGLPVTIRLLDPPLHEFLPKTDAGDRRGRRRHGRVARQAAPAHRGAARVQPDARPSRLPAGHLLSGDRRDAGARHLRGGGRGRHARPARRSCRRSWCRWSAWRRSSTSSRRASTRSPRASWRRPACTIDYLIGTMIELPRAALRAHVIAEAAEFFSFGTNDLTQTTFGISRDDAASFLETYRQKGIIEQDPVRLARHRRRRRTGAHGGREGQGDAAATSSSASAASMAATRPRSISARRSASTTSPARPSACRSPGWPRPRRR